MTVEEEESDGEEFIYAGSNKNPKMYFIIYLLVGCLSFYRVSDIKLQ